MKTSSSIFIVAVVLLFAASACNFVDLKYDVAGPENVGVNLKWNWTGVMAGRPDSMNVVYGRLINTQLDRTVRGVFSSPSDRDTTLTLKNGEYYLLTFSDIDSLFDMSLLDEFDTMTSVAMKDIAVKVKTVDSKKLLGDTIADYNETVPFIKNIEDFYASLNVQTLSTDNLTDISVEPRDITCDLNIIFPVIASKDVKINYVKAYMSGLVGEVHPMTGIVNYSDLYRSMLEVTEDAVFVGDTTSTIYYNVRGSILGLFPPKDSVIVTGPGILNVIIDASSKAGDRKYYRARNLIRHIGDEAIMALHDDYSGYFLARDTVSLEIEDTLRIGQISQEDEGIDIWVDNEYFIDREF